ncbi:hypothetical protein A2690_02220 [Candidatus Roizmanbacteria bacterium RIFCSPHIGHO2_01_FULL_39_12b]|uniref:Uncharacterized protein n=1 Tax=Candidatus Roizmanbacteria bacterium RIFCSPHIGHO2_01_FULL_39_12b TaxID=1802030 RepID=A0A1F7GEE9_9BACT|nr:MAG: hypothetical protein A2690_02220 [Candidatus Roizmanbacteria bacterium RIFCSPHIGHO2_01_FULL_39_12b]OGK47043.1 MAG: hypothetical protein A3B46_01410 [Candidatus Roizmanbacteria bacterium RIFCSPLOWO2_01_FULL_39_19]
MALTYPEAVYFTPTEEGLFATSLTTTRWINFTPLHLDVRKVGEIINFYEQFAVREMSGSFALLTGEQVPFAVTVPTAPYTNRLFFTNQTMPNPYWGNVDKDALTLIANNAPLHLTRIRVSDSYQKRSIERQMYHSMSEYATVSFWTEACQASVMVTTTNPQILKAGQEAFCNSASLAAYMRVNNKSYDEYVNAAQSMLNDTIHGKVGFLLFPQEIYESFPKIGSIFR